MAHLIEAVRYKPQGRSLIADVDIGLTYFFQSQYYSRFYSSFSINEYQEYLPRRKVSQCLGLTIVPHSCADIQERLRVPASYNPRGLSNFVQGLLYLFFRNKGIMDLTHMRNKLGLMNSIERFFFCKWDNNNNQLCKKLRKILISHPEISLQMNNPEWIKWKNQIPFILLINTEHDIIFGNEASWTCALGIMVALSV